MTHTWKRLAIAVVIVLSGMALVPYIALPSDQFSWQRFAGVYSGAPGLTASYDSGAPGSVITITGYNFTPGSIVTLTINGRQIGAIGTDALGGFSFDLDTDGADSGFYTVAARGGSPHSGSQASAATTFQLNVAAPLRSSLGGSMTFTIGAGRAAPHAVNSLVFLPLASR